MIRSFFFGSVTVSGPMSPGLEASRDRRIASMAAARSLSFFTTKIPRLSSSELRLPPNLSIARQMNAKGNTRMESSYRSPAPVGLTS